MIEFAVTLASLSELGGNYACYDRYWDDADRFTRNHLCQSQILCPEKLLCWVDPGCTENHDSVNKVYNKLRGAWAVGQAWPHDLMDFAETESGMYNRKRVSVWGCCSYSGPRGFYACWSHAVKREGREIDIRIPITYEDAAIRISEISSGGLTFWVSCSSKVSVRIPGTADAGSVAAAAGGVQISLMYGRCGNRVVLDAEPGMEYSVRWEWLRWESRETIGMPNKGNMPFVPLDRRVIYTLRYKGNTLISMDPGEGACLPYFEGL